MATRSSKPASKSRSRTQKEPPADTAPIRVCLAILGLTALSIGLPATFVPETFYTDYPFFTALVKLLPPYNEHLITDVGGLYIGFGLMFAWATFRPSRQLVLPLCWAWIVAQSLHFAFHISNLTGFTTTEATIQQVGLAFYILVALVPVVLLRRS
jgi:hypothetical protein